jgi:hypothetical protein
MSGIGKVDPMGKNKICKPKRYLSGSYHISFSLFIEQYSVLYMAQKCQ